MFFLLLYHLVVTLVCTLTGIFFYSILPARNSKPLFFIPVTGLVVISLVAQLAALFLPVNGLVFVVFVSLLLLVCFIQKTQVATYFQLVLTAVRRHPPVSFLLFAALWLMILTLNAGPTMMDDTESYHIQMVKWIQAYGTVPGLANLHARYGFNSSWFSAISFFLPAASTTNYYTALNGLLSVWFGGYLLFQLPPSAGLSQNAVKSHSYGFAFVLLFSLLCWPLIRGNAATANYDFITTVLVFVLFAETAKQSRPFNTFPLIDEWILWPAYLFTIRITNYPLLFLSLFAAWQLVKQKEWSKTALLVGIGAAMVIPFVLRNILLSGYPFYPAKQIAFGSFDWKVDEKTVDDLLHFIKNFNRVSDAYMDISNTEKLTFPGWIPFWFKYLFKYDKLLLVPGLLGIGLGLFNLQKLSTAVRCFLLIIVVQLFSWFFIAPDPRFVYGCLLIGIFLLAAFATQKLPSFSTLPFRNFALVLAAVLLAGFTVQKVMRNADYRNFVAPYQLPQPPVNTVIIDGFRFHIPEKVGTNWNARCYATELPCLYQVNPRLRARGPALKDGFRVEKTN